MPTPISPFPGTSSFHPTGGLTGGIGHGGVVGGSGGVGGTLTPVSAPLTGIASLTVDGVDITTGTLGVRSVRPAATPTAGGIQSSFPLDDLSQITTEGRYAQGFRLDSGSLRQMWMTVRRTTEADGKPGFEIYFQAHGAAVGRHKERLEKAGATSGTFAFFASDPDPSAEAGKSTLKKNNTKWNPTSGSTLSLAQDGKWAVDFATATPEAIKGAMRIRVQGTDAEATKALQEVITKLGLQGEFAPPKPEALEKLKIMRLLWQISSGAVDRLRFEPAHALAAKPELAVATQETDATAAQAIASADLSAPDTKKRAQLAALLYQTSPRGFLEWAKSDSSSNSGILPSSGSSTPHASLETALTNAGVPTNGEKYLAALAEAPVAAEARALFQLGLLAKKALPKAEILAGRDVAQIKLGELQDLCAEIGVSEPRLAQLRFDEVYPGYFTVVDPSLSKELHAEGARYLYSTSDNPERVWQMLSGGQKASLTRFQEGLLIQGKSSSRDFETGGASSVFSRLVTESVITKAKKGESGSNFHDWGGSRPYKLIINRRILDRTDWYGFNGDNYGRTTALKPENHGAALIKTINEKYSQTNEICFPIGNDAAYVDYVACATDAQKTQLIDFLTKQGVTEWAGKPLADFVIVTTKFIEHPEDVTLLSAAKDALILDGLKDAVKASEPAVKTAVEAKLTELATSTAQAVAEAEAKTTGRTRLESSLSSSATQAANQAVSASAPLVTALGVEQTKDKVKTVAEDAAKEYARGKLEDLASYSTYSIDSAVKTEANKDAQKVTEDFVAPLLAQLIASAPVPADATPDTKKAVRAQLEAELRAAVKGRLVEKTKVDGAAMASSKGLAMVTSDGVDKVKYEAQKAAKAAVGDAAVLATDPAALAALLAAVEDQVKAKLEASAQSNLTGSGASWIRPTVKTQVEAKLVEAALQVAGPAATAAVVAAGQEKADGLVKTAHETFAAKFPAKVTPELIASLPEQTAAVLAELAVAAATKQATGLVPSLAQAAINDATTAAFVTLGPALIGEVVPALTKSAARAAAEVPIRNAAGQVSDAVYLDAVKAVAAEVQASVGAKLAEAALDRVGQSVGEQWATWAVNYKLNAAVDAVMAKVGA